MNPSDLNVLGSGRTASKFRSFVGDRVCSLIFVFMGFLFDGLAARAVGGWFVVVMGVVAVPTAATAIPKGILQFLQLATAEYANCSSCSSCSHTVFLVHFPVILVLKIMPDLTRVLLMS